MLADLLGVELAARRERYPTTRTRMAHLPFKRTLEDFDFSFQPSIGERQVKELATPSWRKAVISCCWDRPEWVRRTSRWRLLSGR